MTIWLIIAILLGIGLLLILVEVFLIPGTTFVGLFGFFLSMGAIALTYKHYGQQTGMIALISFFIFSGLVLYAGFRGGLWKRFSLKSSIQSRFNEGLTSSLAVGEGGIALSTLRPFGKAQFKDEQFEVKTLGQYIDPGTPVKIISIESNQIIVEPTNPI